MSKGLKVNLGKTKVMVSGSITKDGMSKSKVDPCGVCNLIAKANSALCAQCSKWIHGRCAWIKRVIQWLQEMLHARNVKGIFEKQWSRQKCNVIQ